jgi:hypothetical protein
MRNEVIYEGAAIDAIARARSSMANEVIYERWLHGCRPLWEVIDGGKVLYERLSNPDHNRPDPGITAAGRE